MWNLADTPCLPARPPVQGERPLNCMLAGYFSRVVGSLLLRRTADTMAYLRRRQELLPALVRHVDTTSIAEVLVRLVGADDQRAFLPTTRESGGVGVEGAGDCPPAC